MHDAVWPALMACCGRLHVHAGSCAAVPTLPCSLPCPRPAPQVVRNQYWRVFEEEGVERSRVSGSSSIRGSRVRGSSSSSVRSSWRLLLASLRCWYWDVQPGGQHTTPHSCRQQACARGKAARQLPSCWGAVATPIPRHGCHKQACSPQLECRWTCCRWPPPTGTISLR